MSSTIACRAPAGPAMERCSFDRNKIDIEDQGRARWNDPARAVIAVGKIRWNDQPAALADLHSGNALIPTLDDRACTQRKFEDPAAGARAIELLALVVCGGRLIQPPGVFHDRYLSAGDCRAAAGLECEGLQCNYRTRRRRRRAGGCTGGRRTRLAGAGAEQREENKGTNLEFGCHDRHLKGFYRPWVQPAEPASAAHRAQAARLPATLKPLKPMAYSRNAPTASSSSSTACNIHSIGKSVSGPTSGSREWHHTLAMATGRVRTAACHGGGGCVGSAYMQRILVLNPKGGSGKTTIATNLASYFASQGDRPLLSDDDPQGSSTRWLKKRGPEQAYIHGVAAFERNSRMTRAWQMRIPPDAAHVVVDTPAAVPAQEMADMTKNADAIIVPVLPSDIDIHACSKCIADLLLIAKVRRDEYRIGVVANRVKRNTVIYQSLMRFLETLRIPVIATLRDSQNYVRAAELGLGIHEMKRYVVEQDLEDWQPMLAWLKAKEDKATEAAAHPNAGILPVTA